MFNKSKKHLLRAGAALIVLVSVVGASSADVVAQDQLYVFNIPAEDTAKALND